MRRRFAVPLIALVGIAPWVWFYPDPAPDGLTARLVSVTPLPDDREEIGGLSGLEVAAAGTAFFAVTDRGHLIGGTLERKDGEISHIDVSDVRTLAEENTGTRDYPATDAEGLALDDNGRIYVSFEHAHRILYFDPGDTQPKWPSYMRAWGALSKNKGLEALAVARNGTLIAIPELVNPGAWQALVFRRVPGEPWELAFSLPVDTAFAPVGADFGPDGRFYLLERGLYPFGFYSRVRAMTPTETGFDNIVTVMQSRLARHGNLEGLSVWADDTGNIRLTMISDDNFHPFMRGEIVEYVLDAGLALSSD